MLYILPDWGATALPAPMAPTPMVSGDWCAQLQQQTEISEPRKIVHIEVVTFVLVIAIHFDYYMDHL